MTYSIHGLIDIYTVLNNERRLGGAVEVEKLRLAGGDELHHVVFTHMEGTSLALETARLVTDSGDVIIVRVDDIRFMLNAQHKRIHELKNEYYREKKQAERIAYLKRLVELNEGSRLPFFIEEVELLAEDIGWERAQQAVDLRFIGNGDVDGAGFGSASGKTVSFRRPHHRKGS